jgi:hypothetical protein
LRVCKLPISRVLGLALDNRLTAFPNADDELIAELAANSFNYDVLANGRHDD